MDVAVNQEIREKQARSGYDYPFTEFPSRGGKMEVAPGVYWVRMPLPFVLDHINLWLIDDKDGWTLVDTGISSEQTREDWESIFDDHLDGKPISRVIVTHLHPDHIGLAGWITRKFNCQLWMSRTDYLLCRNLVSDTGREAPVEAKTFYRAAGFSDRSLDAYLQRFGRFGTSVSHIPDAYRRLKDGECIPIGAHEWQVVIGRGHAPEHVCLYCKELKVLISGDQVLPRISSNVSIFPTEPDADPLSEWLDSCAYLADTLPDDVLVLPAHNEPFFGLHRRMHQLIEEHETNLDALEGLLKEPKRSVDVFSALFKSEITRDTYFMATGESLAHLNCLLSRNRIERNRDEKGVDWYCVKSGA